MGMDSSGQTGLVRKKQATSRLGLAIRSGLDAKAAMRLSLHRSPVTLAMTVREVRAHGGSWYIPYTPAWPTDFVQPCRAALVPAEGCLSLAQDGQTSGVVEVPTLWDLILPRTVHGQQRSITALQFMSRQCQEELSNPWIPPDMATGELVVFWLNRLDGGLYYRLNQGCM